MKKIIIILNKLYFIIIKFKSFLLNKTISNDLMYEKKVPFFDPKLKIYMFGTDLFRDKVPPLINYFNLSKIDLFVFTFFYKNYPKSIITQMLIKYRSIGSFKIIDSSSGEILCIRNFLWVFGVLIWEESFFLGYNGVTSKIITDKYLLTIRDIELRYQGCYEVGDVMPVSFAFEIEGFSPYKSEDYSNLSKWDFSQSKTICYPTK